MIRRLISLVALTATALMAAAPAQGAAAAPPTITEFPIPTAGAKPFGITTGADGNLWFTEHGTDKIGRMTPAGVFTEFALPAGSEPAGITLGPDGNVWFTEQGRDRIGRITPSGSIREIRLPTSTQPLSITAGPDGFLWFTEPGVNRVAKMSVTGTGQSAFNIPLPQQQPRNIIAGPDGNLWFTEPPSAQGGLHGLIKITTDGQMTFFNLALGLPYGLAVDQNDDIWVTDQGTPEVSRFDITTHQEDVIPISGAISWPAQATAAPDGSIWFTEPDIGEAGVPTIGGNKVGHIDPNTGKILQLRPPTPASSPQGITVGPDGAIWFTEDVANNIARINPTSSADAAVGSLRVHGYVIEQQCYGQDLFVDMSALANSPSQPVQFRWDFDNDGRWDTPPRTEPFERPVYVGDGQRIRVRVGARNPDGDRAQDAFAFTAVDC